MKLSIFLGLISASFASAETPQIDCNRVLSQVTIVNDVLRLRGYMPVISAAKPSAYDYLMVYDPQVNGDCVPGYSPEENFPGSIPPWWYKDRKVPAGCKYVPSVIMGIETKRVPSEGATKIRYYEKITSDKSFTNPNTDEEQRKALGIEVDRLIQTLANNILEMYCDKRMAAPEPIPPPVKPAPPTPPEAGKPGETAPTTPPAGPGNTQPAPGAPTAPGSTTPPPANGGN